jgi:plasmid stabilization system protein ParE
VSPLPVRVLATARRELRDLAIWWRDHREKAPDAVEEDFEEAKELLSHQPLIGLVVSTTRLKGVRRIHLQRIGYYIYYRIGRQSVEILRIWHVRRGQPPRI